MAKYIVRIILNEGTEPENYQKLYLELERLGFAKTIVDEIINPGKVSKLPDGTYYTETETDQKELLEILKGVVGKITHNNSIMVTKTSAVVWHNLKFAKIDE